MLYARRTATAILVLWPVACAGPQVYQCPPGTLNLPDCPPDNSVLDADINRLHASRAWVPPRKQTIDPIEFGEQARVPINQARAKIIGPTYDEALKSLAAKIWLIENAQHTIDVMYYIFKRDPVGYAMLNALCDAVRRGVDVRIMVDSLGSIHPSHDELRALETCVDEAGFMRNANGQITTKRARVQTVIFNAASKLQINRRSHDKLLVVDGQFPGKAAVMTGGRNIALEYYGIHEDGSKDPSAYQDLEILLRADQTGQGGKSTIGRVSEIYYTLLFLHKGNKRITPLHDDDEYAGEEEDDRHADIYSRERQKSREKLAFVKSLPMIQEHMRDMPQYMTEGFRQIDVRLVHQLSNLVTTQVTTKAVENVERNPNSIMYLLNRIIEERREGGAIRGTLQIVSPYLFSGRYRNEEGEVVYDGAKRFRELLRDNPDMKLEVVTNSVLTSDNFITQAIIDMEMVPRFLLTPELQKVWRSSLEEGELNPQAVESEEWGQLINHPQIFIYQTGRRDSNLLGGPTRYGKLHARFIIGERGGFIGTSNFDYRSNLYNNEMGYFFRGRALRQDLVDSFELLKATSYRWGTPQWLQMRRELMAADTKKSGPARKQRTIYKTIRALGLEYLM